MGNNIARERRKLILVLGSMIAIGPLTIDMYLPSLPAITTDFLTTPAVVQLTLTGTLLGLGLGQLIVGPISDAVGRRLPLLAGLGLHVLASVLCAVAPNVAVLGVLRVLQGLGAAGAAVVASAVVRDRFSGSAAATIFSRLMLVMGAAPILAPTIGSQVLRLTQWRGVFVVLAVLGVVLLGLAIAFLPETLPPARRRSDGIAGTMRVYVSLFGDRVYLGLILVSGLAMVALFSYVAGSSFVFQGQYGLGTQQFGLVFGAGAAGLIAASQFNVRLLRRFTPQRILTAAMAIGALAGLLLVAFAATGLGGIYTVLAMLWLVLASAGLIFPNAPAIALTRHGEAAGTASALMGAVQFVVGAASAPLVGALGTSAAAMGTVIAGGMLASLIVLVLVVRPSRLESLDAIDVQPALAH